MFFDRHLARYTCLADETILVVLQKISDNRAWILFAVDCRPGRFVHPRDMAGPQERRRGVLDRAGEARGTSLMWPR